MNEENSLELVHMHEAPEDSTLTFRPKTFDDYLGQKVLKEKLMVFAQACMLRKEPLDHLLLFGPPGLGKTTLAQVMAHVLNVKIKITSAPVLERAGDLVALLTNIGKHEIFFIDEIHRLSSNVEEILYGAMEHFCVDMIIGQGAGAQSIRLPIQPFTLIGATTKTAKLSGPLQTRFGIVERLDYYQSEDLAEIVLQNAAFFNITILPEAAFVIGKRARGTPRIVKRIFRRVRDFAQVHGYNTIDIDVVQIACDFLGIDDDGLNDLDRKVLIHLIRDFDGGPVGLETIAALTGEDKETLESYCEPFLIRQGLLQKTTRGRQIVPKKFHALQKRLIEIDDERQKDLC